MTLKVSFICKNDKFGVKESAGKTALMVFTSEILGTYTICGSRLLFLTCLFDTRIF